MLEWLQLTSPTGSCIIGRFVAHYWDVLQQRCVRCGISYEAARFAHQFTRAFEREYLHR